MSIQETHWHLDKKVPLALITAMVMQTAAFGWWAGGTSQRLTDLEKRVETVAPQSVVQTERLVRVETKMDGLVESVRELKDTLARTLPPRRP